MAAASDSAEAARLRTEAAESLRRARESFDSCDTDGFLSQWAHEVTAREKTAKASLLERGGVDLFPGLFRRADGSRVRAKLIRGKFGWSWAFCDARGQFTGKFLPDSRGPRSRLSREGYEVRLEEAPARVALSGEGRGLSGCASVSVVVFRTDGGYPPTAN